MESDQRLRDLLEAELPPETGREQARTEIRRRVHVARRRQRVARVTGSIGAVAAVLVGLLVLPGVLAPPRVPEVGHEPGEVAVTTSCGEYDVPQAVADYLERWTEGSHVRGETCVLRATEGPEPRFDVSGLGQEQVWLDDDLSRGRMTPSAVLVTPGYPVVHVGTIALEHDPDLPLRLLRSWDARTGAPLGWCTSAPDGGGCGFGESGEVGVRSGPDGSSLDLLVPAETAIAALSLDGEPTVWQRPRGRTAFFSPAPSGEYARNVLIDEYTVTAYDAAGEVLAEYTDDLR